MKFVPSICQGLLLTALGFGQAQAIVINEIGDTGNTIPTAQQIRAGEILIDTAPTGPFVLGLTTINGTIENPQDTDLYGFNIVSNSIVTLEMIFPGEDANLLVFNGLGQGLAGNDDFQEVDEDGIGCFLLSDSLNLLDSCLNLRLEAGRYYIGVGDNNTAAFESTIDIGSELLDPAFTGINFFDNDDGILEEPTQERLGFLGPENGPDDFNDTGPYTLNIGVRPDFFDFSTASVPETHALPLLGSSLVLLGLLRRRKRADI